MEKKHKGKITCIEQAAADTFKLVIKSNVSEINPGQFISILCPNTTLRRPFSVAGFKNGAITVLFKAKGEGTKYISSLKNGDEIDFLGPLGHGFNIKTSKALLIGAGIGIAPMLYLKEVLRERRIKNILIAGFKTMNEVIAGSDRLAIGGSVLDEVPEIIYGYKPDIIYACGPEIVLRKTAELGENEGIPTELAMEKVMACGIGVCRGCVIKVLKETPQGKIIQNASICSDGPVFKGSEIVWNE